MILSEEHLSLLCQRAIIAAREAGDLISQYSGKTIKVQAKRAGDSKASQIVTEVDLLSQEIILKTLLPTCKEYDLALLTEESPDDLRRFKKDYFWSIDPLDGTLPFTEGTSGYGVSIALVSKEGIPFIGVVHDPLENNVYHAINGKGAFKNNFPLKVPIPINKRRETFTLITDRSFSNNSFYSKIIAAFNENMINLTGDKIEIINHGGAVMNACWVMENSPSCYLKLPKPENGGGSLWDYSATACIFSEAGCHVSDIYGNPLELNRRKSTFMNQSGILFASDNDIFQLVIRIIDDTIKIL